MAPHLKDFTMSTNDHTDPTQQRIDQIVKSSDVVLFMKGTAQFPMCGFSAQAVGVLKTLGQPIYGVNVLEDDALWGALEEYTQWPTVPQIFINGEFIGGCDIITEIHERGELTKLFKKSWASSLKAHQEPRWQGWSP